MFLENVFVVSAFLYFSGVPFHKFAPLQGSTLSFVRPSGTGENAKKIEVRTGQNSILIVRRDRYKFHIHVHYLLARTGMALWGDKWTCITDR